MPPRSSYIRAMLLLYGATGYTGRLIAHTAAEYGLRPVLAGRDHAAVAELAGQLGLDYRVFSLDDDIDLSGSTLVLHCAGPFIHTSAKLASACIRQRVHYVDITGEIDVFEQLHARDREARNSGVMLLPGAGFDVVPSDCLGAFLKAQLPSATQLNLGIAGTGRLSRGTAATMITHADKGGMIRRDGQLVRVPPAFHTREIDFGAGPRWTVTIPWGDVATAYYSTGIPNIRVYSALPRSMKPLLLLTRYAGWLMRRQWLKDLQLKRIRRGPPGPTAAELRDGRSFVYGEAVAENGDFVDARLTGPNGYLLTAHSALLIAQRILRGDFKPGFQTPSLAYGADFVLAVPGVTRHGPGESLRS
ncbi:MAG TPA: saccharopine dehydrogenase NADP-binding domain-containing protein [Longimicrobiales bacterium]